MALERGFKSWAERTSISFRNDLALQRWEPLPASDLARRLGVRLLTPRDVPGLPVAVLDQLLKHDPDGWSAVSICEPGRCLVIYNSEHSVGRQASDIMHELAHLILGHAPSTLVISHDFGVAMRSFNQKQEEEANWLAWSLLLPREALVHCARQGMAPREVAAEYGVSEKLVNFRRRVTGVEAQVRARRKRFGY